MNVSVKLLCLAALSFIVLCVSSCSKRMPQAEVLPPNPVLKKYPASPQAIVLDPGHGGDDFGTRSCSRPWVYEKNLALRTAKLVYGFLKKWGYEVRLTRNCDVFIPLLKRTELANLCKAQLFVSIHYNSAPSKQASGIEVFYYRDMKNKVRMFRSERLAKSILDKMLAATKANSRGVKAGNFAVIRETNMPAVLVEAGFLSNRVEASRLKNTTYLEFLAHGIAKGIEEFVSKGQVHAGVKN